MEEWVVVADFEEKGPDVQKEIKRWKDVAEDLSLYPERNVRLVEDEKGIRVEISYEMHDFLRGC